VLSCGDSEISNEISSKVSVSQRGVDEDSDILECDAKWDSGSRSLEGTWTADSHCPNKAESHLRKHESHNYIEIRRNMQHLSTAK